MKESVSSIFSGSLRLRVGFALNGGGGSGEQGVRVGGFCLD